MFRHFFYESPMFVVTTRIVELQQRFFIFFCKKSEEFCYLLSLSYLAFILLIISNFIYFFFNFILLTFDF